MLFILTVKNYIPDKILLQVAALNLLPEIISRMKKSASRIFKIVSNKYLIALAAFVLMMLFFDENNIFLQLDRKRQLNNLLKSKAFYQSEISKTQQQLTNLQNSPAAVEKFARENFLMKRDNEDIFIVETPDAKK